MSLHFLRRTVLSVVVLAGLGFGGLPAVQAADKAAKNLSKAEVEQIVHDYIVNNPQVILDAVNEYHGKAQRDRQNEALAKNKDFLFKDSGDPEAGNLDGDVTIVEFFDYNCHYCKSAFSEVQELLKKDNKVRIVFKDFPILGPSSETAAKWALAAQKQKKYFEFHKAMMSNKEPITDTLLGKVAAAVGLDVEQAKKDADSAEVLLQIEKNRTLATQMSISGTPAFIVGDEVLPGSVPLSVLEQKVEDIRKKGAAKK